MSLVRAALVAAPLALWVGACGGAAVSGGGAETTSAPAERAPLTELDALQRDFDVNEARLVAELERRQEEAPALERKRAEQAPKADAPTAPKAAAPSREKDDESAPPRGGSACDLACRALGSMRRAAEGICSLTGEQEERCTAARQRTELSAQRVAAAGCLCRP